jgi:hypothetical protein
MSDRDLFKFPDDGLWRLGAGDRHYYPGAEDVSPDDPLVTIDALVDLWEMHLEGANYHSMMPIPEHLVATLRARAVPDETIKLVLWDIIGAGGWM